MGKKRKGLIGRKIRRLFSAPSVLLPTLTGGALGLLALAGVGSAALPGLALLGLGAGIAALKWTVGAQRLTKSALEDELRDQERAFQDELKRVRRTMRRDRDPHTSGMVKKLKHVFERMWSLTPDPVDDSYYLPDIYDQISGLYRSCLGLLERSMELWRAAQSVATEEAKERLLGSRNELIEQVEASIDHLDATLDSLQTSQMAERHGELAERNSELQQELEQGLEVARAVEQRMEELERELRTVERE